VEAATIQIAIELLSKLSFWQSLKMRLSGVAKSLDKPVGPVNPREAESGFMPAVLHINGEEILILKHPEPLRREIMEDLVATMKAAMAPGTRGLILDGYKNIGWFGPEDRRTPGAGKSGLSVDSVNLESDADADKR
jgi:hypothetical protein